MHGHKIKVQSNVLDEKIKFKIGFVFKMFREAKKNVVA